jgi:uncharacterized protein
MNIIDFHVHAGDFHLLRDDIQELLTHRPMEDNLNVVEVFSQANILENYLKQNGICRAVLLAECGPGTNYTIDSEVISNFAKDKDFFIPFGNINPNYHDVKKEFWKSIELGVKGFKFYPADHSFNALIDEMNYVYKMCELLGLPIMFHTGLTAQKDTEQKFINPLEFQPIAEKYPELVIILAHGGKPYWYAEASFLTQTFPNVYIDTALLDPLAITHNFSELEKLKNKIIFGSDWPVVGSYSTLLAKYRQAKIPEKIMASIFYLNAQAILHSAFQKQQCTVPVALENTSAYL